MYIVLELTRQSILSLIVVGIFIALFIRIGLGLRKYNEMPAVVILCGALTSIALLYFQKHPETIDMLEDHPILALIGVFVAGAMLVYHILKKQKTND